MEILYSVIEVLPVKAHLLVTGRILWIIHHYALLYTIHHQLLLAYYLHDN